MKNQRTKRTYSSLMKKAEKALREAVRDAIRDHIRTGDPMYVWRNGKVVKVSAAKLLRQSS